MTGTGGRGPFSMRDERGAATAELAMIVPAFMLMLALLVAGGRLWYARTIVFEAGYAAARAGSLARTATEARIAADSAGRQSLATAGLMCEQAGVSVATAAFRVPAGRPATVSATVRCTVSLADVVLPGLPGGMELSATGAAALDTYRSRG